MIEDNWAANSDAFCVTAVFGERFLGDLGKSLPLDPEKYPVKLKKQLNKQDDLLPLMAIFPPPRRPKEVQFELGVRQVQDGGLLVLADDRPLLSWLDTNAPGELCETSISTYESPACLVLDRSAILDLQTDYPGGGTYGVELEVSLQVKNVTESRSSRYEGFRITFDVFPYEYSCDEVDLELVPDADIEIEYPILSKPAYLPVAKVKAQLESHRRYSKPLSCFVYALAFQESDQEVMVRLSDDEDTLSHVVDDAVSCSQNSHRVVLSAAEPNWELPVYALFGRAGRAVSEPLPGPGVSSSVTIKTWLSLLEDDKEIPVEMRSLLISVVPQSGVPKLKIRVSNSNLGKNSKSAEFTLARVDGGHRKLRCEPRVLRAIKGRSASYRRLFDVDLLLSGALEQNGEELIANVDLSFIPASGIGLNDPAIAIRLQDSGRHYGMGAQVRLCGGARSRTLSVYVAVHTRAYQCLIDKEKTIGQVECRLQTRDAAGNVFVDLLVEQEFRLSSPDARKMLAIDLGTSAIAVAYSDAGQPPESVNLGDTVSVFDTDHDERGSDFISSIVGLDPDHVWRGTKAVGASTWRHINGRNLTSAPVSARDIAKLLKRNYAVAVPFAPAGEFGLKKGVVLVAPKMLLMEPEGVLELPVGSRALLWSTDTDNPFGNEIHIERLVSDILDELAEYHLPWAGVGEQIYGSRLVLTHPSRYSAAHKERLKAAVRKFCERIGSDPDDVALVAESDAAATYFLTRVEVSMYRQGVKAVAYDLGAGTLDLSLLDIPKENDGQLLGQPRVMRRVGASVGGDTIDLILYFILDALLHKMLADCPWLEYHHPLLKSSADVAGREQYHPLLAAKRNIARAIRAGKADLTERCRSVTESLGDGAYHWPPGEDLVIKLGEKGSSDWPVHIAGDWMEAWTASVPEDYARLTVDDDNVIVKLSKRAVQRPAMIQLMKFMTDTVVRKMFTEAQPGLTAEDVNILLVSGRAALWPLIHEGLAKSLTDVAPTMEFAFKQPPTVDEMKNAVVKGALMQAHQQDLIRQPPAYDQIGLLMFQPGDGDSLYVADWEVICEDVKEIKVAHQVQVMLAPPGVTLEELQQDPWAISMLLSTGSHYSARDIQQIEGKVTVVRSYDEEHQEFKLSVGGMDCEVGGGKPQQLFALHTSNFDVTKKDAPPGFPASVAPESFLATPVNNE